MPIQAPSLHSLISQAIDSAAQLLGGIGSILFHTVGDQIVAAIDDKVSALEETVNAEEARIVQGVSDLNVLIQSLRDEIAAQGVAPETLAKLDAVTAKVASFNPTVPAPAPAPEPTPTP